MNAKYYRTFFIFVTFIAVFIFASHIARQYESLISVVVHNAGIWAPFGFVALTALFVVFVIPLDIVFLIPMGVSVWGALPVAFMSITGWVLGSAIAFYIARHYGSTTVRKIIGLKRVKALETRIPQHNLFWLIVAWRMAVSVDILSYALGLVSTIPFSRYILATAIGVIPFGFFFAYVGVLSIGYQVVVLLFAITALVAVFYRYRLPQREP